MDRSLDWRYLETKSPALSLRGFSFLAPELKLKTTAAYRKINFAGLRNQVYGTLD